MNILKRKFILIGIFIVMVSFILGFIYQDSGCGICGGYGGFVPHPVLAIRYIPNFSRPSPESCAIMGCSTGVTFPLFIDIFSLGVISIFAGLVKKRIS